MTNGSENGRRRVVITGMGAVSPLGNDVETSWRRLLAGESGAGEIPQFDHTDYKIHFACEVKDFDPTNWIEHKEARRIDRFVHLILAAAYQAQADAHSTSVPRPTTSARRSRQASAGSSRFRTVTTR